MAGTEVTVVAEVHENHTENEMQESGQSTVTQFPAGQSTNAVLDEIRRMNSTFTSELKSVSDRVDRLAETIYNPPAPKKRKTAESVVPARTPWYNRRDSGVGTPLPVVHDSDDESVEGDEHTELSEDSKTLIVDTFSAPISNTERRIHAQYPQSGLPHTKCPKALNPDIQDLASEEDHFWEAAPQLFGSGFKKAMKDRAESMKILQKATKPPGQPQKKFFQKGRSTAPQRGSGQAEEGSSGSREKQQPLTPASEFRLRPNTSRQRPIYMCFECFENEFVKNILVNRGIRSPVVTIIQVAGRLALFRDSWERVTKDQWVLEAVMGYRIELLSTPTQQSSPRVGVCSSQEQCFINEEISKMLSKGAITVLLPEEANRGFYSSLFLVPEKDGGMRPVIKLKSLNKYRILPF